MMQKISLTELRGMRSEAAVGRVFLVQFRYDEFRRRAAALWEFVEPGYVQPLCTCDPDDNDYLETEKLSDAFGRDSTRTKFYLLDDDTAWMWRTRLAHDYRETVLMLQAEHGEPHEIAP